jgi:hypothetical protein
MKTHDLKIPAPNIDTLAVMDREALLQIIVTLCKICRATLRVLQRFVRAILNTIRDSFSLLIYSLLDIPRKWAFHCYRNAIIKPKDRKFTISISFYQSKPYPIRVMPIRSICHCVRNHLFYYSISQINNLHRKTFSQKRPFVLLWPHLMIRGRIARCRPRIHLSHLADPSSKRPCKNKGIISESVSCPTK